MTGTTTFDPAQYKASIRTEWRAAAPGWRAWFDVLEAENGGRAVSRTLVQLARVGPDHHVLVGYLDGDPAPVGIARLVRHGESAEIAFAVADEHQSRRVGSTLANELAAELSGKRVEVLRELVPKLARLAVIWYPDNPIQAAQVRDTRDAAQAFGGVAHILVADACEDG